MYANFNLNRELKNELTYGRVHSPNLPLHFHSHIEVYLIRSGEIEVLINNKRKVLGSGELCFSFGYDAHGYRTVGDAVADYLIVPINCCNDFLPLLTNKHVRYPFINDPKTYQTVADAFEQLFAADKNELLERGYAYVILGTILDKISSDEVTSQVSISSGFWAEILIYISTHFRENLTLSSVAKEFGYHPSYFSRSFQQTFGIHFIEYLTMLRLREVVLLLQSQTKSVTECAYESGFGSMRSFYRAFNEEFGCSPKEYLLKECNGNGKNK